MRLPPSVFANSELLPRCRLVAWGLLTCALVAVLMLMASGATAQAQAQVRRDSPLLAEQTKHLINKLDRCQAEVRRIGSSAQSCVVGRSSDRALDLLKLTPPPKRKVDQGWLREDNLSVSVLTEEQVQAVFEKVKDIPEIRHLDRFDDCVQRAWEISDKLRREPYGVSSGFIIVRKGKWLFPWLGSFDVKLPEEAERIDIPWGYHVAPFVVVKKNGKEEVYVLDPLIEPQKPISQVEWESRLSKNPSLNTTSLRNPVKPERR